MLTSGNLKGKTEFSRQGVIGSVVIPENLKNEIKLEAEIKDGKIELHEGDSVYIATDTLGIISSDKDETQVNMFFVEGGMIVELLSGSLVLAGANGLEAVIDELGEVTYLDGRKKVNYLDLASLYSTLSLVVEKRYNLPKGETHNHMNNLLFNLNLRYFYTTAGGAGNHIMSTKVVELFEDLGLGQFVFSEKAESDNMLSSLQGDSVEGSTEEYADII